MKNETFCSWLSTYTLKDTWDLGTRGIRARGLSDCVDCSWRDWNHERLAWAGWRRPWISACPFIVRLYSNIFIFISNTYLTFPIYFFSKIFGLWGHLLLHQSGLYLNPDDIPPNWSGLPRIIVVRKKYHLNYTIRPLCCKALLLCFSESSVGSNRSLRCCNM
jgi:hypothetical protein